MNNVCILTDTHFGHENNSENVLDSSIKFFNDTLIPFLNEHKITKIFILGDLFDSRTSVNTKVHNVVFDLFNEKLKDFEIYIIIGNHDIYYNSTTSVHSLKFLHKFENVHLIDEPQTININGNDILMVPWLVDETKISELLENNPTETVMGHFDIVGFSFNKHTTCKVGTDPNTFSSHKYIFSGHFHTRSDKKINDTNFVYVGTPYQLTRADMGEERGFVVYNVKSHKYKFFSNDISTKFIELKYPEHFTEKTIKNNRIDVVIEYTEDTYTPDEYDKYIEEIESFKPVSVNPCYQNTSDINPDMDDTVCSIGSIPDLVTTYVNKMKINDADKKEINDMLIGYHNKVKK